MAPGASAVAEAQTRTYEVTFLALWALAALLALSACTALISVSPQLDGLHRMQRAHQSS